MQSIKDDLRDLNISIQEHQDIDQAWESLKTAILNTIEKRVPSKMTTSRHTNPWMNTEIKRVIRRKQRAHRKARRTNAKRDTDRYKCLQREVQYKIRRASRSYMVDTVSSDCKDNSKKFWAYVKSKGQEFTGVAPLKNQDGFLQSDTKARANILNEQFKSVFTREDLSNIPDTGESDIPAMHNIKIDWKGVHKLLKNLKVHKATGPDEIPAYILKTAADELAPALALLFQLSMDQGEIPQDWKQALVVPIFKKGDKHQPSNYRPVSLTSITCKLLEHIIHSNIMHHFDQHRVLCDNQHGFRKKRSCETQLLSTIQEIASSTAKGHQVDIILLDFAKAFDKVPHTRLLHKLDHYGVRGNVKRWIESFLSHREQRVILDGVRSESAEVLSGVPQGTVLGPLLFLCFINDLPESIKSSQAKLFADDSLLFRVIKNDSDRALLQKDLSALEHWENTWQMSFNPIKCVVLRISTKKKKVLPTQYELYGHTLEVVDSSKYLGVTIKDDLSWGTHIQNTVSKANRTLGFLRRNMKDCTKPVKDLTYKAMIRPTMEYSSTVWDPALQTHIAALEQVQRRAARYVFNDYHSRTPGCVTKMIDNLNWEPLEVRRRHERLGMLYRIQHNLVDIPIDRYLQVSDSRTRGPTKFFQERISDATYSNSFFPRTVRDWNKLPVEIVSAASLEEFRSLLWV